MLRPSPNHGTQLLLDDDDDLRALKYRNNEKEHCPVI